MTFAQWVRASRESLRPAVSQEECAHRIGVSQAAWAKYETQSGQPKRETVKKIANALGVSHTEALSAAGYQSVPMDVPAELATIWQSVPRERQAGFLRAVRSMADAVSV